MKKQLFILCILLAPLFTFGQNAEMARAYYTKAKEAYSQQDYQQALKYLENAKEQLGSTNPDITYMEIKSKNGLGEFDEDLDILINDFLQKSDADDDRRTEMNMLLIDLEEKREVRREEERRQKEAQEAERVKKAEEARLAEEARVAEEQLRAVEVIAMERKLRQTMVKVEGGTFEMGNKKEDNEDKIPVHEVTLSTFYIGKYPITKEQWKVVMENERTKYGDPYDNHPMIAISWNEAQEFLKKLNQITNKNYRLPTEAEWEFAAKGGNKSKGYRYSGSSKIKDVAWYEKNSIITHPVGQKKANELNIYDMSGNVWEWCNDWYDKNYYNNSPKSNPQGPVFNSFGYRVQRGGSYKSYARFCQVDFRGQGAPSKRYSIVGFRVVLSED